MKNEKAGLAKVQASPLEKWKADLFKEGNLANFGKALSGTGVDPQRFAMQAYLALQRNDKLLDAPPMQLWMGVFAAAECGLSLQPHLQQYHLVPFNRQITPIVGYQGLTYLASKAGGGLIEPATIIYQRDIEERRFKYREGVRRTAELDPVVRDPSKPKGELRYVMVTYVNPSGTRIFKVLEREQLLERRERSSGWLAFKSGKRKSSPWEIKYAPDGSETGDWLAMCAKTAIRDIAKVVPKSADHWGERSAKADAVENAVDMGEGNTDDLKDVLDSAISIEGEKTGGERMKERLGIQDAEWSPPEPPPGKALGDKEEG